MELRLSHSKRARFRKCPKLFKLHDINRVRSRFRPSYFAFGTATHEGIRAWLQGIPIKTKNKKTGKIIHIVDRIYAQEIDMSRLDAQKLDKINVEKAKVKGIIDGYIAHYRNDKKNYPKIVTEREETVTIPGYFNFKGTPFDRVTYFGKIDCLMQDKNGDWWIKETKTTADDVGNFIAAAKWNAQVCGYMLLAKATLGKWPRGILYDVIVKSGISQRKSKNRESLAQFQNRCYKLYAEQGAEEGLFIREKIIFNARHLKIWMRETKFEAEDILDAYRNKRFPMNFESCKGKYGLCDMFNVCSSGTIKKVLYTVGK